MVYFSRRDCVHLRTSISRWRGVELYVHRKSSALLKKSRCSINQSFQGLYQKRRHSALAPPCLKPTLEFSNHEFGYFSWVFKVTELVENCTVHNTALSWVSKTSFAAVRDGCDLHVCLKKKTNKILCTENDFYLDRRPLNAITVYRRIDSTIGECFCLTYLRRRFDWKI